MWWGRPLDNGDEGKCPSEGYSEPDCGTQQPSGWEAVKTLPSVAVAVERIWHVSDSPVMARFWPWLQSRPDSVLGFQIQVLKVVPSSLGNGMGALPHSVLPPSQVDTLGPRYKSVNFGTKSSTGLPARIAQAGRSSVSDMPAVQIGQQFVELFRRHTCKPHKTPAAHPRGAPAAPLREVVAGFKVFF